MTTTTVALSALLPPKNNPRRAYDRKSIEGLAQTIAKDGLIHNLTVCPEKGGKYRIIAGMRRFLALQHLTENGTISRTYKVPVRIEKKGSSGDLDRVAMVENVQREALDPIDEAEAFAKLLQGGAKVEDIAAETGVSVPTIRRRLALADLCEEVKKGVRDRKVTLSVAEVLTLATPAQQKNVVRQVRKHGAIDAAYLRSELLAQKPSVADAIFPLEWYAGTLTKDLFADKETTYFDDGEQFLSLQAKAVEALAEEHRKSAAWVEMVTEPVVHWWRYREAKRKEPKGVVIHLHPSGKVEVRQNLVQQEIDKEVVAPTKSRKPVEKPEWTKATIRYVNAHTVVAVQAALLRDRRVAKTVVAFLLLTARQASSMIGLKPHDALQSVANDASASTAYGMIEATCSTLLHALGMSVDKASDSRPAWFRLLYLEADWLIFSANLRALSEEQIDSLIGLLVILSLGTRNMERLGESDTAYSDLASSLALDLRAVWTPGSTFLAGLRREQLLAVAKESGAIQWRPSLTSEKKGTLVTRLAEYFARTADPSAELNVHEQKGRAWLPACMRLSSGSINNIETI